MNAPTPIESLRLPRIDPAQRAARRAEAPSRTHAAPDALTSSAASAGVATGPLILVLTAFWTYVALSNVLYARSMSIVTDPHGTEHFFAAWDARVLQHIILYPLLLVCVWLSLRVGWRPLLRAVPTQLALGLGFATLAGPVLGCSEWLVGEGKYHYQPWTLASFAESCAMTSHQDISTWIASITSFVLTYGFALALVTGFALYRRFKESELRRSALERAWSGARLAALRMQLSPHTLFNLLHTIRGQIAWDPAAARQMVVQLGDLLRRLLAAGERDLAPLSEEVEFARLYLELQQQRFADRLSLELPDPAALPHAWVPSLILQPLVENAVAHGLADHAAAVVIRIEGEVSGSMLHLRVINTMAAHRTGAPGKGSRSSGGGIGLRNVRERLAMHFADRAVLEAGAAADDGTAPSRWVAEIRMPLITSLSTAAL